MEQKLNESYCFYSIGLYPRLNVLVDKKEQKENTLTRPVLFIFLSHLEKIELMDALKCWMKSILF